MTDYPVMWHELGKAPELKLKFKFYRAPERIEVVATVGDSSSTIHIPFLWAVAGRRAEIEKAVGQAVLASLSLHQQAEINRKRPPSLREYPWREHAVGFRVDNQLQGNGDQLAGLLGAPPPGGYAYANAGLSDERSRQLMAEIDAARARVAEGQYQSIFHNPPRTAVEMPKPVEYPVDNRIFDPACGGGSEGLWQAVQEAAGISARPEPPAEPARPVASPPRLAMDPIAAIAPQQPRTVWDG